MNTLHRFIYWVKSLFSKKKEIEEAIVQAADFVVPALGAIDFIATIVVSATPSRFDDIFLMTLRTKYPRLFSGELQTGQELTDELRLMIFGAATHVLKEQFPHVSDATAKAAVAEAMKIKDAQTQTTAVKETPAQVITTVTTTETK